jgi:Xaa-Pro aminopeptidase
MGMDQTNNALSPAAIRLAALRAELASRGLDGFVVPLTDEHMSEYVGDYAQRLRWLTGFEGSAGTAVVMADRAVMFTDGRYILQVKDQVDGRLYDYEEVPATSVTAWLQTHVQPGQRIGFDPWLHSRHWAKDVAARLKVRGAMLVSVTDNPLDCVWTDRPAASMAPLEVHDVAYAGRSSAEKRAEMAAFLKERGADALVVTALDSLAWLLNVRGRDVPRTPVALGFAVLHADASVDLFMAAEKLGEAVRAHLGPEVRCHGRQVFASYLSSLSGKRVVADPAGAVAGVFDALEAGGATIVEARDPCVLAKAIKNPIEIAGTRAAHLRDGAALTRFLHWLSEADEVDELTASDRLHGFRRDTGCLEDLSFDTISGAGPNGAVVHYRASEATNRRLERGSLYLVDSGGQYRDGTTDVTRTIAIGTPDAEMRDRYTRVLKGHVALARAVFPKGTRGGQLDVLARHALWAVGLDYAHGTGHGVGSYLAVHEGPQRIASAGSDEPLVPGMILSDEPGYYKAGAWGIRIENLLLVTALEMAGAEREMLGFETLTLAPYDRALIEVALLDEAERAWVDAYHARVLAALGPLLEGAARDWLVAATQPL